MKRFGTKWGVGLAIFAIAIVVFYLWTKPTKHALREKLSGITRISVSVNRPSDDYKMERHLLFELKEPKEIDEWIDRLDVLVPQGRGWNCFCWGNPQIDLYRGSEKIATISVHHTRNLRTPWWKSDVELTAESRRYLMDFLLRHGLKENDLR